MSHAAADELATRVGRVVDAVVLADVYQRYGTSPHIDPFGDAVRDAVTSTQLGDAVADQLLEAMRADPELTVESQARIAHTIVGEVLHAEAVVSVAIVHRVATWLADALGTDVADVMRRASDGTRPWGAA